MLLITGATGNLGKTTIDFLLNKIAPNQIAALVRDIDKAKDLIAAGVETRTGDYYEPTSLVSALKDINTLLLISTNATENRLEQHRHVIDAAKINKVKHIVYTSMLKASENSIFEPAVDHFYTEEYIKETGIPYTILRNSFYAEIIPLLMGDALQTGNWYYPAANTKVNFVSRKDIAEALSIVLISPATFANQTYEIASGTSYSFAEIAGMASIIKGRTVTYMPIPLQAMKEGMKQAGLPEPLISLIASGAEAIAAGEVDITDNSLEVLLKRKPTDLKACLPELLTEVNEHLPGN